MRAIRSSLTLQLALLAVVPAILATAAMVLVMASQHLRDVRELSQANARNAARQLAQWAQGPMAEMDRRALLRVARSGASQTLIQQVHIWSWDGELLAAASSDTAQDHPVCRSRRRSA